MKTKLTIAFLFFSSILFISLTSVSGNKSSSQAPTGRTGAPGEGSCGDCHSGGSYSGQIIFEMGEEPVTAYTPSETYTIAFSADFNAARFGFSMTALDANDQPAGDFTVLNADNTSYVVTSNSRQYVGHKNASNLKEWEFEWTAPASDVGNITFYYVINAADGNNGTSGDYVELGSTSLTPAEGPETFDVTFNLILTGLEDYFNPDLDVFFLTGSFFEWAIPGDEPELQTMTRVDESFVFTKTLELEAGTYEYKYFLNEGWEGGEWEGNPNREIVLTEDLTLEEAWGALPGSEVEVYALDLLVQPENSGNVTGAASFIPNAFVQITAAPEEGYEFINWTDADQEVVSAEAEYQFKMPRNSLILTANFDGSSLVDESEGIHLLLFPNPAQDDFCLRSSSLIKEITIIDVRGKVLWKESPNAFEARIENHWGSGVYLIRIITTEGEFFRKLLAR
ncbi:MAG: choice-of-anchor V domain-containing protein [Bacteroides sp.]|nr:choice-of-anchor V domain-containing protein [Bacteroides sp.]